MASQKDPNCNHEYYQGICVNCGCKIDPNNIDGEILKELPSKVDLQSGSNKKTNDIPPHILAEMKREEQTKKNQIQNIPAAAPKPKIKIKDSKQVQINIPINRFSVGWSEDETQVVLKDEIYDQDLVMIEFQNVIKKLDKDKKIDMLRTIVESFKDG